MSDFERTDLLVVGGETEGCLAAVAAARAGARVLHLSRGTMLGGLLTENGLAYVDRDSRHLLPPGNAPDGLFGSFLAKAGVSLVALSPSEGHAALSGMFREAKVEQIQGCIQRVVREGNRLVALELSSGETLCARHFLDATPDGDLAEAFGLPFQIGFREYGLSRFLGVSPLPRVCGVSPERIEATCAELMKDPALEALRERIFGARRFLSLERGADYLLIGPPHLGLAYQRWREERGLAFPHPFEADGFNVAVLGPDTTSWNGLIYFSEDPATLLRWSRGPLDPVFIEEAKHFERFLREGLGWLEARVEMPDGLYVRQTRHALATRRQLTLRDIAASEFEGSVGTFCYYPDFRGFQAVSVPGPLVAPIPLEAGLFQDIENLGIASRAGGYTPFAHSLCRLVQYNATLGTALGIAAAFAESDLGSIPVDAIRGEMVRQGILADDQTGLERNALARDAFRKNPLFALE